MIVRLQSLSGCGLGLTADCGRKVAEQDYKEWMALTRQCKSAGGSPLRRGLGPVGGACEGRKRKSYRLGKQCLQVTTNDVDKFTQGIRDVTSSQLVRVQLENRSG